MPLIKKKKKRIYKPKPKTSKIEVVFGKWMKSLGIKIETQFKLGTKYYDFKIKDLPILIEFNGDYWHANPLLYESTNLDRIQIRNKKNDAYKKTLAISKGYYLLYIWENEFKTRKAFVKKTLLTFIQKISSEHIDSQI